jgi:hypothetical protein
VKLNRYFQKNRLYQENERAKLGSIAFKNSYFFNKYNKNGMNLAIFIKNTEGVK